MMCFIEKQLEQANAYCFFEKPIPGSDFKGNSPG